MLALPSLLLSQSKTWQLLVRRQWENSKQTVEIVQLLVAVN